MSTKQDTTNKYDPTAMNTFHALQPGIQNVLLDAMADPKKSSFFLQNFQAMQKQNQGMLARSIQNLGASMGSRGISSNSGLYTSQMAKAQRASSANTNNAYLQALNMSSQRQMDATRMAQGYSPLQTGSTVTTSGLGTWLPQVIGAGLGMASGFMGGGGMMGMLGGASKGMGGGGGAMGAASGYTSPVTAYNASNPFWFPNMPQMQR